MDHSFSILAYHKIDLRKELGINSISPQKFERQIGFLEKEGYECLCPYFFDLSEGKIFFSNNNCSDVNIKKLY